MRSKDETNRIVWENIQGVDDFQKFVGINNTIKTIGRVLKQKDGTSRKDFEADKLAAVQGLFQYLPVDVVRLDVTKLFEKSSEQLIANREAAENIAPQEWGFEEFREYWISLQQGIAQQVVFIKKENLL
jgi:hypothetical protein